MGLKERIKKRFRNVNWSHFHTIIKVILIVLIPISMILSVGQYFLYDEDYYHKEFTKVGTYERVPNADKVLDSILLFFKGETDELAPGNFTSSETKHLYETKSIISSMALVWYVLVFVKVILFITLILTSRKAINDVIHIALGAGTLSVAWPIMLSEIDFNYLFIAFHNLFFPGGGWMFPKSSLLIQLFPKEFFLDCVAQMALNSIIMGSTLIVFALVTSWVTRAK